VRRALRAIALLVAAPAAGFGQSPPSPAYQSLRPEQRAAVERGEPVQLLEPLAASAWPRSIVYQFIEATPEECAAVLSDYDLQATYMPRTKISRVIRRLSRIEADVEYVIDVPIYPDEHSVSRQTLTATSGEYAIRWQTVVSDSDPPKSITSGRASFQPLTNARSGRAGTLMVHDQSVVPSSMLARVSFVRNKAIQTSRDIALAIGRQVELERAKDPTRLQAQITRLRKALASAPDSGKLTHLP
jgi:hypothetical protein